MKALLVGSGGREHAIARSLAGDAELHAAVSNLNPGIADLAETVREVDVTSPDEVVEYALDVEADVAVVGPEAPLQAGVVDALEDAGVYGFGPKRDEARIETDKAWARRFMTENEVPGAPEYEVFGSREAAADYVEGVEGDVAVKPRGLTGGKGVRVTGDQLSKQEASDYVLDSDWDEWVVEERLVGEEFTLQAFVADGVLRPMPLVQDHKRAYEGDRGPNTGGMGSYSDAGKLLPFTTEEEYERALSIMQAVVDALPDYRGVLYGQFMLTVDGPKVVEFNARFGDPEAMNVLSIMETSLVDVLEGAMEGGLPEVEFEDVATVCKYAVPEGYPVDPEGGAEITLSPDDVGDALLYYASVDSRDGRLYTTTSRSIAVVGRGASIDEAEHQASEALEALGPGLRVRDDVGKPHVVERRMEHMKEIRDG